MVLAARAAVAMQAKPWHATLGARALGVVAAVAVAADHELLIPLTPLRIPPPPT